MRTLAEIGTPWAECYRGSGRFTGHLAAEPVRTDRDDVAPGWVYVGEMTEEQFYDAAEADVPRR